MSVLPTLSLLQLLMVDHASEHRFRGSLAQTAKRVWVLSELPDPAEPRVTLLQVEILDRRNAAFQARARAARAESIERLRNPGCFSNL